MYINHLSPYLMESAQKVVIFHILLLFFVIKQEKCFINAKIENS